MMISKIKKSAKRVRETINHNSDFVGVVSMVNTIKSGWGIGDSRVIDRVNTFKLISLTENKAVFIGTCVEFRSHSHPEVEVIRVLKGEMKDRLRSGSWRKGDVVTYDSMDSHEPYDANMDNPEAEPCLLEVTFFFSEQKFNIN